MDVAIEALGWTGSALVLFAYVRASRGDWPASGSEFAALNVTGAMMLSLNAWHHGAFPSVALNVVWTVIGVATLVRLAGFGRQTNEGQ
ncbi:MAG: hypothetical protein QOK06_2131 [Acidimicrobiaceae bacterium]|jgi:hypothetical protein